MAATASPSDVLLAYQDSSSIGAVINEAKKAVAVADISLRDAVMQILAGQPAIAKKVAGDWLDHRVRIEINNQNLGSSIDQAYPIALRLVMQTYAEVRTMYETGAVSGLAMRTVFRQWFKD